MDYFIVGGILLALWCLVLFLDWIQTFIIGSERVARLLCSVFSNRILSLMIYWPLYTITAIVGFSYVLELYSQYGWGWVLLQTYIELPISWFAIPLMVHMHTDEEDVRSRWLNRKLRKSEDLDTSVKAILAKIEDAQDAREAKLMANVLKRVSLSSDTFGYNVRKIIEEHNQK